MMMMMMIIIIIIIIILSLRTALTAWRSVTKTAQVCVISGFRREVDENSALRGYCAASNGNFLPTFRGNLSATSLRVPGP
jgi:hypothetical protein